MVMDEGGAGSEPLMIPAAAGLAALTVKSFLRYGWPVAITGILSGDGRLDLIDTAGFSFDPYPAGARSPLAYQITERLEELLQASGFVAFTSTPFLKDPVLTSAPSMQRPQERPTRRRDEQGQREAEELVSRLPYTLAVTRFAHFIKVMMREEIGTRKEAADIEMMCNSWLGEYVVWQSDAPVEIRAERPLRRASVSVEPTDVPGFSKVSMKLQPHYQVAVVDYEVSLTTDIQVATGENLRGKADGA
jgi:type VI secretion system protein ImpC